MTRESSIKGTSAELIEFIRSFGNDSYLYYTSNGCEVQVDVSSDLVRPIETKVSVRNVLMGNKYSEAHTDFGDTRVEAHEALAELGCTVTPVDPLTLFPVHSCGEGDRA